MRLAFYLQLPIDREWHAWANERLDSRYGSTPSHDDRDVTLYPMPDLGVVGSWPRSPNILRKNAAKVGATGRNTEGQLVKRGRVATWLLQAPRSVRLVAPLGLVSGILLVVVGALVLGLALS